MASIQEVQAQISEAEKGIANQRQQISEAQKSSAEQLRQLEAAKSKVPSNTSQRSIRQTMTGLMGQVKRQAIEKVKQNIENQKKGVQQYQKGLQTYSGEISKYEQEQLNPVKQQVASYQEQVNAYEEAKSLWYNKNPGSIFAVQYMSPLAQQYYKDFAKASNPVQDLAISVKKFEVANPTEKLVVDWDKLRVTGVQSGSLGQTFSVNEYNKMVAKMQDAQLQTPTITTTDIVAPVVPSITSNVTTGLSTGFRTVSALPVSSDKGLSSVTPAKTYGLGSITGASISENLPSSSKQSIRTSISDFFGRVGDTFKADITKGKEIYSSQAGGFVSASPTGIGATAYIRPPTQVEQARFDVLNQNILTADIGKVRSDIKQVERLSVELPKIQQDITKQELILKDLEKGNVNAQGQFVGSQEAYDKYVKAYDLYNQRATEYQNKYNQYEASRNINVGIGELTRQRDIREFQRPISGTAKMFTATAGAVTGVGLQKELDWLGVQRVKPLPLVQKLVRTDIVFTPEQAGKAYGKVVETGLDLGKYTIPVAGEALFAGEIAEAMAPYKFNPIAFAKGSPREAAFLGGALLTGGIIKGLKIRSDVINKAVNKALEKDLSSLENAKIKSINYIDEASGKVMVIGEQKIGNINREFVIRGIIKDTESGKKFIPEAQGLSLTYGIVTPEKVFGIKLRPRVFEAKQTFEAGSQGTNILKGTVGDVRFYEELGKGTLIPKESVFGITKIPKTIRGLGKTKAKLEEQMSTSTFGGDIVKEFSIPVGKENIYGLPEQRNTYIQINKALGLRINPQELGVVIKVPKKTKDIGFTGGGQKSSKEFLTQLYASSDELSLASLSKVASKGSTKSIKDSLTIKPTGRSILEIKPKETYSTSSALTISTTEIAPSTTSVKEKVLVDSGLNIREIFVERIKDNQKEPLSIRQDVSLTGFNKSKEDIIGISKFRESQITPQKVGQPQKTTQAQRQEQLVRQREGIVIRPRDIIPKPTFKPKFTLSPKQTTKYPKRKVATKVKVKKSFGSFDVYTRVKGKEVLVAPSVTKEAGLDIGAATTLFGKPGKATALSASIILKPSKAQARKVSTRGEFGKVKDMFRVGKVSGKGATLTLVQKETKRLGTSPERKAIIESRKGGILNLR